jgi:class 3 adenylate cyclase
VGFTTTMYARLARFTGDAQVTVLFADVNGSMDFAEQVEPEEWHEVMDRFHRRFALPR